MQHVILIGLGTSGSEIIGRVAKRWVSVSKEGSAPKNHCQFIAIDSDENSRRAISYISDLPPGAHVDMTYRRADELRREMWEHNPFFRSWWDGGFTNIPPAVEGAGTVPAIGRLIFWGSDAATHFPAKLQAAITNATYLLDNEGERRGGSIGFYLVGTVCGGSGSGIFLDVASWIRQICKEVDPYVYGCFVLPSIVKLRALREFHDHIDANGFAALLALDLWQGDPPRPAAFDVQMRSPRAEISGGVRPFDLCYLFTRMNEQGQSLRSWDEYFSLIADGIATDVMGSLSLAVGSRVNDLANAVGQRGNLEGRPARYASFAVSRLRFRADRVLAYLGGVAGQRLAQEVLVRPEPDRKSVV